MEFQVGGSRGEAPVQTLLNYTPQPQLPACTPSLEAGINILFALRALVLPRGLELR